MWALISTASETVSLHPGMALLIAFLAAIVEAVAVLGILIPGTPILMAVAGAGAAAGLSMTPILLVSILGAVIGDGISFWLGHRYGGRLRHVWPLRGHEAMMARAEAFFRRARIVIEPVTLDHGELARQAFLDFGKGRHKAALNYGDCFSYAAAISLSEPLLCKGDDFIRTDVPIVNHRIN